MKRVVMALGMVLLATACQDATSPRPEASLWRSGDVSAAQVEAGSNLYAVVDINCGLVAGNQVASVACSGFGQFEVTFTSNVSGCAYAATTTNAYSQALNIFPAGGHSSVNGVWVETKNQGGGLTQGPFHLVVTCNSTIPYAVVGYTANLVRASTGVSMSSPFAGLYYVTFPTSVASCAYIATVADPANALVYSPSGVYTGSGPNSNTVYIETKNPGGGVQGGIPFHLAVVCAGVPRTGYAVVRAIGTAQRGSPPTGSVSHPGTGLYTLTSTGSLAKCAKVATRGSENTNAPFNPATVEMAPGPNANSANVQVRALLFFGGALVDESFHAAVIC